MSCKIISIARKKRCVLLLACCGLGTTAIVFGQFAPARETTAATATATAQSDPCLQAARQKLFADLADFAHYASANSKLPPPRPPERRVVFMGDSITEFWARVNPEFFARADFVDRGISGQTTLQMLLRFRQDVIALRPAVVHILAGTNDIAGNTGPMDLPAIEANIASMVDLARANGIRVVLGSVLPASDFPWKRGSSPGPKIVALNQWLRKYAQRMNLIYADYYGAVSDGALGIRSDLSTDGVHPTREGYLIMDRVAETAIGTARQGLSRPTGP